MTELFAVNYYYDKSFINGYGKGKVQIETSIVPQREEVFLSARKLQCREVK